MGTVHGAAAAAVRRTALSSDERLRFPANGSVLRAIGAVQVSALPIVRAVGAVLR